MKRVKEFSDKYVILHIYACKNNTWICSLTRSRYPITNKSLTSGELLPTSNLLREQTSPNKPPTFSAATAASETSNFPTLLGTVDRRPSVAKTQWTHYEAMHGGERR